MNNPFYHANEQKRGLATSLQMSGGRGAELQYPTAELANELGVRRLSTGSRHVGFKQHFRVKQATSANEIRSRLER